jgi:hypothetical protein
MKENCSPLTSKWMLVLKGLMENENCDNNDLCKIGHSGEFQN